MKRVQNPNGQYFCPACREWKYPNEYYKSTQTSVGLSGYCKECARQKQKEYLDKRRTAMAMLAEPENHEEVIAKFLDTRGYTVQWHETEDSFTATAKPPSIWDDVEAIASLTRSSSPSSDD